MCVCEQCVRERMATVHAASPGTVTTSVQVIGWYIVTASAFILAFVVLDAFRGLTDRKWWFPCKFTTVNAVTLAVLGVATKLPNDISTTMSGGVDQLAKLSGSALICAFIAFALPTTGEILEPKTPHCVSSQGRVTREALLSNVMALGLLLLTTAANICTQMVTGVIFRFHVEHILVLVASILCFGNVSMAALDDFTVPLQEARLKIESSWLVARGYSRQYLVSRSIFGFGAGATYSLCLASFVSGISRTHRRYWNYGSEYGWSTWWILVIQFLAILVCWACVTVRWLRPLLYGAVKGISSELPDCVGLQELWVESAFEVDIPWWRPRPMKPMLVNIGRSSYNRLKHLTRLGIMTMEMSSHTTRTVVMCKKVLYSIAVWVMNLFCLRPSELLWWCCLKLSRSKPASVLLKCLYDKEEVMYFIKELEAELIQSDLSMELRGVWLSDNPRGELQWARRGCSKEEMYKVTDLVEVLRNYDTAKAESYQYSLQLRRNYKWWDVDEQKPWPLSVGAAVLVLMEVWRGVVFEEEEVDTATKAVWQAGQVAHLVDLISNPSLKARRGAQRVLVDLFTTKKKLRVICTAFREQYSEELDVEGMIDAVRRAISRIGPKAKFLEGLEDLGGALRSHERPRADCNQLQWLRDTVKNHLVCILGDYIRSFPDIEKEARQIAAQYDCEELCVWAFIGSIKARRAWRSLGWGHYPIDCAFSEIASHGVHEDPQPPPAPTE